MSDVSFAENSKDIIIRNFDGKLDDLILGGQKRI